LFSPPRCPNADCIAHSIERCRHTRFFVRHGYYRPRCRPRPVPRFRCRNCRRTFSRQTFRQDYRDHKPHLNAKLLELLAHGLGLRQSAMILKLSRRCAEMKARKLSRHLEGLNKNLLDQFPEGCSFQMDEMESFEQERTVLPITVPVLIEQESMFIVDARSAAIRASGKMSERRLSAIKRRERAEGARRNDSRGCLKRVLREAAKFCKKLSRVRIDTDEKSTYPGLIRQAFGPETEHRQSSSKLPRDSSNRLFPINHINAMARYLTGRLRRRSWLSSKQRRFLDLQLNVLKAYKNFVRPRFNGETETPGMVLGLVRERLAATDLVSWRQDWGWYSPHPVQGHLSIREARARDRRQGRAAFQVQVEKRGFAD
jgi:transposase-like protein